MAGLGSVDDTCEGRQSDDNEVFTIPRRRPILREGFFAGYGVLGVTPHEVIKHRIAVDPGMSGGPVLRHPALARRETDLHGDWSERE